MEAWDIRDLTVIFSHAEIRYFSILGSTSSGFLNVRTTLPPHGNLARTYSLFCNPLSKTLEN